MDNPEQKRGILVAIFKRSGDNGSQTMLFDDATLEVQQEVASKAAIQESEQPVVLTTMNGSWSLITTERVIWYESGSMFAIANEDIEHVALHLAYNARMGIRSKLNARYLTITTTAGNDYILEVESGTTLSGTLNVLRWIAERGEHHG